MEKYWIYHCGSENSSEGLSIFSCGYQVLKLPKIWFVVAHVPVSCLQFKDEKEKKKKGIELPPEINSNFQIILDLHLWIKSKKLSGGFCCLPLSWCFQQLWLYFFSLCVLLESLDYIPARIWAGKVNQFTSFEAE